ncbi:MAG TPA: SRPBCC domain-containing protein [Thermomicrobiales bacterium]|nr:SRPBCC domain-containing protein [Thermomicrobiales bacterium]
MPTGISTINTRLVHAPRARVYQAFINPDDLLAWLPPGEMTGRFHEFDARVGGGYRMSLFYPPAEQTFRGKTADNEDLVNVRFVELSPPRKLVETVIFDSPNPAFAGEMLLTVTLDEAPGGTNVTMRFENLPPGLRPEDNEAGAELSLGQLARYLQQVDEK